MSVSSLRQLYYNLIYPYISYGLASWGAAFQTRLQTVRTKQNKCIRSIFFASQRENASIYYKLLKLHNLDNIFNIKIASLVYKLKYLPSNTPAALHKLINHLNPRFCLLHVVEIKTFSFSVRRGVSLQKPIAR